MISHVSAAVRIIFKRLGADWLIIVAAFITIVMATVLLASGPIYAEAVTLSALQQSLSDPPAADSNISVEINVFPEFAEVADEVVREVVGENLAATGADIFTYIEADAYGLDDSPTTVTTGLVGIRYLVAIDSRASHDLIPGLTRHCPLGHPKNQSTNGCAPPPCSG